MTKTELLKLAESEIGYTGKKNKTDNLDIKEAPNGKGLYTKYARDLYQAAYFNGNKNGYEYCSVFLNWLFWMTSDKSLPAAKEYLPYTNLGASCRFQKAAIKNAGYTETEIPEPGCVIFFKDNTGTVCHVGVVRNIYSYSFDTVEGNVAHEVATRNYTFENSTIDSIWKIPYDCEETDPEEPAEAEWETVYEDGDTRLQKRVK